MRKLVEQFNSEHQNIKVSMNVLQWADFYAKVPTAVQSGNGPDIAIMHIDQLATNAARRVIIPVDEVATVLEYQEADVGRLAGRRLQGAALRHPAGHPPAALLLQPGGPPEGRPERGPKDKAGFEAAIKG